MRGGVVLLPYLDGERTPNLPDATGTLTGLRTDTEPAQLARAAYEGVVCGLLDAFDALARRRRRRPIAAASSSSAAARARAVYPQLLADLVATTGRGPGDRPSTWRAARASRPPPSLTGRDVATVAREWAPSGARLVEPDSSVDAAAVRDAYRTVRQRTYPESGAAIVIRTSFNDDWRFRPKVNAFMELLGGGAAAVGAGAPAPRRDDRRGARRRG